MELNFKTIITMFDYLNIRNTPQEIHSIKVSNLCYRICIDLKLDLNTTKKVFYSAMLHDIGQIAISENIMDKDTQLSHNEFSIIKTHVFKTVSILKTLDIDDDIIEIIKYHHERLDGTGYPYGVTEIPYETKILMIADVAEAMMTDKTYRPKQSLDYINNILLNNNKFDHDIAKICLNIITTEPYWDKLPIPSPQFL